MQITGPLPTSPPMVSRIVRSRQQATQGSGLTGTSTTSVAFKYYINRSIVFKYLQSISFMFQYMHYYSIFLCFWHMSALGHCVVGDFDSSWAGHWHMWHDLLRAFEGLAMQAVHFPLDIWSSPVSTWKSTLHPRWFFLALEQQDF